ncbi:MAG: phosphohistidine phosphatase SixA [Chloroflexi bacterium]|nr:phosphohistidine phosphatase SixA [Chloroflexota bacterium]
MKLYFFRHGQAEDAQMPDFDDFTRRLTDKGRERTEAAGKALVNLGVKPARLYSSQRARARETAEILSKHLGIEVIVREEVGFGFHIPAVEALIADLAADAEVMFVGHEPDLSATISALIGGGEVVMKKGGMARVDIADERPIRGTLVWLLAPRVLDAIAGT